MGDEVESQWENFAQQDAEFFVWGRGSLEEFVESGKTDADYIFREVAPDLPGRRLAIEIGVGVGRLALPMAEMFESVLGVDTSTTMLSKLDHNCAAARVTNVNTALVDSPWDEDAKADFVYSWTVFQHIESMDEIGGIVNKIARALGPGGIALLHFDTRPRGLSYRIRNRVPAQLMQKTQRPSIRRIRRSSSELVRMFEDNRLEIVRQEDPDTKGHLFTLRRPRDS